MYMQMSLDDGAYLVDRAHDLDAGLDLRTPVKLTVPRHGRAFVDTGVHVRLPWSTRGHVCSKSGLMRDHGIFTDGTIDEGYDGSIGVTLFNLGDEPYTFQRGDKVAQLVIERIERPTPLYGGKVSSGSERGDDGFGSTGR